jgi:NitT/TauT family transport system substrate-binding protein
MMTNMPGAILAVRQELIDKKPKLVQKLVELHIRATEFLILDPERSATDIFGVIGKGPLTTDIIDRAITSPYAKYVSDPYRIMASTQVMHDFLVETGGLPKPVSLKEIFELKFYNKLSDRRP